MPRPIPRDESLDATIALIRDPYGFVRKRCQRHGSDLFETRLLLRRTVCMTGPEAARLFYDEDRFARRGVMPERIRGTLLGRGGVQGLDDAAHRHRKRMFMALMAPERIARLASWRGSVLGMEEAAAAMMASLAFMVGSWESMGVNGRKSGVAGQALQQRRRPRRVHRPLAHRFDVGGEVAVLLQIRHALADGGELVFHQRR